MAAAMRKVHIGIKNRIFISPLSVLTLRMETIGENVTGNVLKKVCADRSWFNSTKRKETTSPLYLTRGRGLRFHSVLTSCFGISDAVFICAFLRAYWAIPEQVK